MSDPRPLPTLRLTHTPHQWRAYHDALHRLRTNLDAMIDNPYNNVAQDLTTLHHELRHIQEVARG